MYYGVQLVGRVIMFTSMEATIMNAEEANTDAYRQRIDELEAEVERLKNANKQRTTIDEKSLREAGDTIVDVVANFFRSAAEAHIELARAAGEVLDKAASAAQRELELRPDENARDVASRIPSALARVVADSLSDQSKGLDRAVSRFGEAFKKNRSDYRSSTDA